MMRRSERPDRSRGVFVCGRRIYTHNAVRLHAVAEVDLGRTDSVLLGREAVHLLLAALLILVVRDGHAQEALLLDVVGDRHGGWVMLYEDEQGQFSLVVSDTL